MGERVCSMDDHDGSFAAGLVLAAGCRPRFTWWSMRWDCLSSSRSPKASDTIVEPPAYSFNERIRAASLADKAYDSDAFRAALEQRDCLPVIPSNASRAGKIPHDKELYKARSEIECTFNLLKQARRFATRYEKTLRNYAAVVALGCAMLWLRI